MKDYSEFHDASIDCVGSPRLMEATSTAMVKSLDRELSMCQLVDGFQRLVEVRRSRDQRGSVSRGRVDLYFVLLIRRTGGFASAEATSSKRTCS